jgi:hypothetical protein
VTLFFFVEALYVRCIYGLIRFIDVAKETNMATGDVAKMSPFKLATSPYLASLILYRRKALLRHLPFKLGGGLTESY